MDRELRRKNAPDDVKRDREDRADEIIARAKRQQPALTPQKVKAGGEADAQPKPPE